MENSLNEETSNFCSIIKNIIGKDVVDSKIDFEPILTICVKV